MCIAALAAVSAARAVNIVATYAAISTVRVNSQITLTHFVFPIYRNLPDNLFLLKNKSFPGTKQSGPYGPISKLGDSRHYPINWQLSWVVTATFSIVPLKLKELAAVFTTHLTSAAKVGLSQNIM